MSWNENTTSRQGQNSKAKMLENQFGPKSLGMYPDILIFALKSDFVPHLVPSYYEYIMSHNGLDTDYLGLRWNRELGIQMTKSQFFPGIPGNQQFTISEHKQLILDFVLCNKGSFLFAMGS